MQQDTALLNAVRRMEGEALTEIFDEYSPALHKYIQRTYCDPRLADHIVGDVFARLLEQLSCGKGPNANLRSYLFEAAYHLLVDQIRYIHRRVSLDGMESLATDSMPAHLQSEHKILVETLHQAIREDLTEHQRQVILLRFEEGYSLQETAAILGKSVNMIKAAQNRAMVHLRKCLGQWLVV